MDVSLLKPMVALAGALALLALSPTAVADANGIHSAAREVFAGDVGSYSVRVVTAPIVGNVHMDIYVASVGTSDPVVNAALQISGQGPLEGLPLIGPIPAKGSLVGPNWYSVDLQVEEVGDWFFTLEVDSSLGQEAVDFPLLIVQRGSINWGIIAILVVFLVAVPLVVLPLRRLRKKGSGRRPRGSETT